MRGNFTKEGFEFWGHPAKVDSKFQTNSHIKRYQQAIWCCQWDNAGDYLVFQLLMLREAQQYIVHIVNCKYTNTVLLNSTCFQNIVGKNVKLKSLPGQTVAEGQADVPVLESPPETARPCIQYHIKCCNCSFITVLTLELTHKGWPGWVDLVAGCIPRWFTCTLGHPSQY